MSAARVAKNVEIKMGKKTSAGEDDPAVALKASMLTGIIVSPDAFKTMNII